MKENNYSINLAEMSELFNNKTLRYRINGFAQACRMEKINVIKNNDVLFANPKENNSGSENNGCDYYFVASKEKGSREECIVLKGQYYDLVFSFTNYIKRKNLDRKIIELPFAISLFKKIDNDVYHLQTEAIDGIETKFIITKSREYKNSTISYNVHFYANVDDFSKILKLVKAFVYNPELVFMSYRETMNQKKIIFTNHDLDSVIMQDANLDKPVGKIKKKIKKIIN